MAERDDGFLSRWSRRKRDPAAEPDPTAGPEEDQKAGTGATASLVAKEANEAAAVEESDEEAGDPEVIAKLPDIDSLGRRFGLARSDI